MTLECMRYGPVLGWWVMGKSVCRLRPAIFALGVAASWAVLPAARGQAAGPNGQTYALTVMQDERLKVAAADRQKKLLADAQQLLDMAQALKKSVDATRKDELSVDVIRQADKIEKLAKSVKDGMRE